MHRCAPALPVALALCALTAACTGPKGGYPSLAISPAERAYWQARPVAPAPAQSESSLQPDASVTERLAALSADAQAAHQRFLARLPDVDRLTAAAIGSAVGDQDWSVAQLALAGLVSARGDTSVALTGIDAMLVTAQLASANAPSPDLAPVRAAHEQVSALVASETATVNSLAARL